MMMTHFVFAFCLLVVKGYPPPQEYDTCADTVQSELRYNMSGRTTYGIPVAINYRESLADAVCCDSRVEFYAEPYGLYAEPDVDLFSIINETTTFYDSVCGLALFRAPVNRTMNDFYQDTKEHGWPSFRSDEVYTQNVITNKSTGLVSSSCGTHLGSFLPDDNGDRWCIDLSCISGTPSASFSLSFI